LPVIVSEATTRQCSGHARPGPS